MSGPFDTDNFDFETWVELAETDPAAFEAKRKALLDEVIAQSPDKHQQRLRGIQFQVDSQRQLAKNPIDSMQRIYGMMMENVYKENGLLHALEALTKPAATKPLSVDDTKQNHTAEVISFDTAEEA